MAERPTQNGIPKQSLWQRAINAGRAALGDEQRVRYSRTRPNAGLKETIWLTEPGAREVKPGTRVTASEVEKRAAEARDARRVITTIEDPNFQVLEQRVQQPLLGNPVIAESVYAQGGSYHTVVADMNKVFPPVIHVPANEAPRMPDPLPEMDLRTGSNGVHHVRPLWELDLELARETSANNNNGEATEPETVLQRIAGNDNGSELSNLAWLDELQEPVPASQPVQIVSEAPTEPVIRFSGVGLSETDSDPFATHDTEWGIPMYRPPSKPTYPSSDPFAGEAAAKSNGKGAVPKPADPATPASNNLHTIRGASTVEDPSHPASTPSQSKSEAVVMVPVADEPTQAVEPLPSTDTLVEPVSGDDPSLSAELRQLLNKIDPDGVTAFRNITARMNQGETISAVEINRLFPNGSPEQQLLRMYVMDQIANEGLDPVTVRQLMEQVRPVIQTDPLPPVQDDNKIPEPDTQWNQFLSGLQDDDGIDDISSQNEDAKYRAWVENVRDVFAKKGDKVTEEIIQRTLDGARTDMPTEYYSQVEAIVNQWREEKRTSVIPPVEGTAEITVEPPTTPTDDGEISDTDWSAFLNNLTTSGPRGIDLLDRARNLLAQNPNIPAQQLAQTVVRIRDLGVLTPEQQQELAVMARDYIATNRYNNEQLLQLATSDPSNTVVAAEIKRRGLSQPSTQSQATERLVQPPQPPSDQELIRGLKDNPDNIYQLFLRANQSRSRENEIFALMRQELGPQMTQAYNRIRELGNFDLDEITDTNTKDLVYILRQEATNAGGLKNLSEDAIKILQELKRRRTNDPTLLGLVEEVLGDEYIPFVS